MRDMFSNAFMLFLTLVFLVTFTFLIVFVIKYAKAYTVKNKIISMINIEEGFDEVKINDYITSVNFTENINLGSSYCNKDGSTLLNGSVCVTKLSSVSDTVLYSEYYVVEVPLYFDIPIFDVAIRSKGVVMVKGETKNLYKAKRY